MTRLSPLLHRPVQDPDQKLGLVYGTGRLQANLVHHYRPIGHIGETTAVASPEKSFPHLYSNESDGPFYVTKIAKKVTSPISLTLVVVVLGMVVVAAVEIVAVTERIAKRSTCCPTGWLTTTHPFR